MLQYLAFIIFNEGKFLLHLTKELRPSLLEFSYALCSTFVYELKKSYEN